MTQAGGIAILAMLATQGSRRETMHGGDRERLGEYLSSECVTCHQLSGRSTASPRSSAGRRRAFILCSPTIARSGGRTR